LVKGTGFPKYPSHISHITNIPTANILVKSACKAIAFNQDIGNWNIGKVTTMNYTFFMATSFNQDIGSWDVSKVTTMTNMFNAATTFTQIY
jgi:surface protein